MKHEGRKLEDIFLTAVCLGCLLLAFSPRDVRMPRVVPKRRARVSYDDEYNEQELKNERYKYENLSKEEQWAVDAKKQRVAELLRSIGPRDNVPLFAHWERDYFGIKGYKHRPKE